MTAWLGLSPAATRAQQPTEPSAGAISLDEALRHAFGHSPDVAAAEALVAEAEGRRTTAATFPHNPELSGEAGARVGPDETSADWAVGLEQAIPLGGQIGLRKEVAAAELLAVRASYEGARRMLAARVRIAFIEAVRARELVTIDETQIELARNLVAVAEKRFAAGASTRLDVNLARVDLGRAEGRLSAARGTYAVARAQLAESIGAPPARAPTPAGTLEPVEDPALPPLPELLELARKNRTEMVAAEQMRKAARARVELADAEGIPALGVSVFFRREAGVESIIGGGLAIPLPLFDRNQGAVAEARAGERRSEAEQGLSSIRIEREVVTALAELESTSATAAGLRAQVVGTLEENLSLLQQAFESGKVAGTEVLIFRQQFRDSQVELVEALASAALARIQLDAALGRVPVPSSPVQESP